MDFQYIDLSAIDQETKRVTGAKLTKWEAAPSRARQLIEKGDVLVSTVRPNLNGVAKVGAEYHGATASTGFCVIRPKSQILDHSFLFHWVKSKPFVSEMVRQATGASYPAVSDRVVLASTIPLPDLAEQRRIAAILDKADALRVKRREVLQQLNLMAASIFIGTFGDPATNPLGFEAKTLGEIVRFEGGSQPPAATFSDTDGPDKIRLVQIRDFKSDRFKTFIPRTLAKRHFETDDVMIGRYGPPVFQILRGLSGSYNVALMKAVPKEGISKEFVFYLLQEKKLHNFVVANSERTAGQSGVNLDLLERYQAYRPPLGLQEAFTRKIATLNLLKRQAAMSLSHMERMFLSLQHRAFTGTL
ncbi:restriction endonuclease subunit S [Caballeronia zhejiangensis]|uniref:restriction endonuclease subunit S n=1 Tax=Caballeronia zhejiangensis TaxID=871203 RepID=UPI001EF64105|nr:restriction endonuclease subunit S [Caballeronia zhejiangensis]MCG7400582.1 restriction endonuclease subunit S [Caballeronia zhejiangensis]